MSKPRRFNDRYQDRFPIPLDVVSHNATATVHFHKCTRDFILESVDYINPTGLASDDTNYFVITIQDGSTVMASYSTKTTGGQGTITADTFTTVPLSATAANLDATKGDVIALVVTLHGTQTLPAGRIVLHGRYF